MVTLGILYTYTLGAFLCWQWLALASAIPALSFSVLIIFAPESPSYLVSKEKYEKARNTLTLLRGDFV